MHKVVFQRQVQEGKTRSGFSGQQEEAQASISPWATGAPEQLQHLLGSSWSCKLGADCRGLT